MGKGHTILCVDDEKNILNSIKRLFRNENYQVLTASNCKDAFDILEKNNIHLIISDQGMPDMSGTEFLAIVKEQYPDILRIILTGYTDIDLITEAVNKGYVFKFILKPWDDQNIKMEIRNALDHYNLIQANKMLHQRIIQQNEELKNTNENLEELVCQKTAYLEIQNNILELSQAILVDVPIPIMGVSKEGIIVLINKKAEVILGPEFKIQVGCDFGDHFPLTMIHKLEANLMTGLPQEIDCLKINGYSYHVKFMPLSDKFHRKGVILMFEDCKSR